MATNQEGRQAALRVAQDPDATSGTQEQNWNEVFALASVTTGTFNERLLAWINIKLSSSHASLPAAQAAYASTYGFTRWTDQNTLTI